MFTPRRVAWHDANAEAHHGKHGVLFAYAARVFRDPARVDLDVSRPEDGEARRKSVGTIEGKLFVVVYAPQGETAWIISARRANAKETRAYGYG
ncbi:BrnT family toxin [Phenylobacterium sp.]|uniref:BrnT family toxin n=1 Tax=Phenylobacterium sp. TaxID=1871053 RepID=UPI00301BB3CE